MRWPLVLIHGFPFDRSLWAGVEKELAGRVRLIIPDLPGFNGSGPLNVTPSMDRYADFIAELMDRENVSAAVVAGMSMGGYVALSFAENYPDRLAGLGLFATQAAADTDEARKGRAALIEKIRSFGPHVAADALAPKLYSTKNAENAALLRFPQEGAAKAGVEGLCWALQSMANRPDRTFVLRNLECPSVVVHGEEDRIIPVDRAAQMSREGKGTEFVKLREVGHGSPLESAASVADSLLSLMQRAETFCPHKHTNRPPVVFAPTEKGL